SFPVHPESSGPNRYMEVLRPASGPRCHESSKASTCAYLRPDSSLEVRLCAIGVERRVEVDEVDRLGVDVLGVAQDVAFVPVVDKVGPHCQELGARDPSMTSHGASTIRTHRV